jgi:hypothetical protein
MASWHENQHQISISNVNLNEPQEIPLETFQEQSEWMQFCRSNCHLDQHQESQLGFSNGCILAAVPNRQVPAGSVVPSMQLMGSTLSFSECGTGTEPRSQTLEDGHDIIDRKQKRIIKNRESAARSRARKLVTN